MIRRIAAFVLLAGFVLLIVNILFIGYHRTASLTVYAIVAVAFIISISIFPKNKK
ncbi:hypothetical protein DFR58_10980 [Anaerobacterium chartisolvens]|uniref:Uncharacterized protein n=1 Tax=Anaerobacterium chartisolvens TaxID=1297424 RepID=A0A369B5T4_9FIRM|nr:hypothetical protein [Anaerobacterium chartisolvens]RCX16853.1 hypothetical protein DFR58_10980 [Anaerobacterium chartisolvens]